MGIDRGPSLSFGNSHFHLDLGSAKVALSLSPSPTATREFFSYFVLSLDTACRSSTTFVADVLRTIVVFPSRLLSEGAELYGESLTVFTEWDGALFSLCGPQCGRLFLPKRTCKAGSRGTSSGRVHTAEIRSSIRRVRDLFPALDRPDNSTDACAISMLFSGPLQYSSLSHITTDTLWCTECGWDYLQLPGRIPVGISDEMRWSSIIRAIAITV